uniref:CENPF protein n=1 Tax=Anisakis simplex TaxID=6269 RepID=A0A0M3JHV5_ANISI
LQEKMSSMENLEEETSKKIASLEGANKDLEETRFDIQCSS